MTKNAVLKAIAAIGKKSAKFGGESVSVLGFRQPKEPAELNYLYPGDRIGVFTVRNRIMCEKTVNGTTGWVNLDYTEFFANSNY